jgi:hypothetical protein
LSNNSAKKLGQKNEVNAPQGNKNINQSSGKNNNSAFAKFLKNNKQQPPGKSSGYPQQSSAAKIRDERGLETQALSSPGIEPLLPEDDISAFFKAREVGADQSGLGLFVLKFMIGLFVILFAVGFAYKKNTRFRIATNAHFKSLFNIDLKHHLADSNPKKQPLSKIDKDTAINKARLNKGLRIDAKRSINNNMLLLLRSNGMRQAQARIEGKCPVWSVNLDCVERGLYLSFTGSPELVRPMIQFDEPKLRHLPPEELALWHFSLELSLGENDPNHNHLNRSMAAAKNLSPDLRQVIFDELIVNKALQRKVAPLKFYLNSAKKDPAANKWSASFAKWNALLSITETKTLPANIAINLLKSRNLTSPNDPRVVSILGPGFIRSGLSERYLAISLNAIDIARKNTADQGLLRAALSNCIRVLWSLGRRDDAKLLLDEYGRLSGHDHFYRHFRAASLALLGDQKGMRESASLLRSGLILDKWESQYLLGHSYLNSGNTKGAIDAVSKMLLNSKSSKASRRLQWSNTLKAEILSKQKNYPQVERLLAPYFSSGTPPIGIPARILSESYMRQGKIAIGQSFQLKIDDARSRKGYWSSLEMLESPFGALALLP